SSTQGKRDWRASLEPTNPASPTTRFVFPSAQSRRGALTVVSDENGLSISPPLATSPSSGSALPQGSKGLTKWKGRPVRERPIVKSGFRQIPPNMLQAQKA